MVRTRSMTAVVRRRNLIKTKAASPKSKSKRAAAAAAAQKMMEAAERAVDVHKILRLKEEAMEAMETKCFPLTARANLAAEEARAKMAAEAQRSGAQEEEEEEEKKKKKKKVVKYLVSQRYIDHMKAGLFNCVDEIPEDELAKRSPLFQEGYRASLLLSQKLRACQEVLLDQYNIFGYAYDAKEVTDDEGEGEGEEEGEAVVEN